MKRKRKRVCKDCAAPPLPGGKRCAEHREAHNKKEAARRAARRASGQCVVCGELAELDEKTGEPQTLCKVHNAAYAARRKGLKDERAPAARRVPGPAKRKPTAAARVPKKRPARRAREASA